MFNDPNSSPWRTSGGNSYLQREFVLVFDRRGHWVDKFLPGYSHVMVGTRIEDNQYIWLDPTWSAILQYKSFVPSVKGLKVVTLAGDKRHAVRVGLQTCATLVQYTMGIWLSAYTPQGLFTKLTQYDDDYLSENGILEVSAWPHP